MIEFRAILVHTSSESELRLIRVVGFIRGGKPLFTTAKSHYYAIVTLLNLRVMLHSRTKSQ